MDAFDNCRVKARVEPPRASADEPARLLTSSNARPRVTVVVCCSPLAGGPDVAQLSTAPPRRRSGLVRSGRRSALRSSATRDRIGRRARAAPRIYRSRQSNLFKGHEAIDLL
jgi:hypothetical protein